MSSFHDPVSKPDIIASPASEATEIQIPRSSVQRQQSPCQDRIPSQLCLVLFESWWGGLNFELQIFHGIGILGLIGLAFLMVLTFLGMDDSSDFFGMGGHGSGLGVFSARGVTAFLLGFGWGGVIALKIGLGLWAAVAIGVLVGAFLMLLIVLLMTAMLRLQSSGNLDYSNAIGLVATVYVTIPPHEKAGGQVEIMIQGRLSMAEALFRGDSSISPGTKVKVTEKIGASTLLVELLTS